MTNWLIEPQDPVIVRDGRPFSATPGARADSLPFPYHGTVAGLLRTLAGQNDQGVFEEAKAKDVLQIELRGPLLAELRADGTPPRYYAPAPRDALWVRSNSMDLFRRLTPIALPKSAITDLPDGLLPVGMSDVIEAKPAKDTPAFWRWEQFQQWLMSPDDFSSHTPALAEIGIPALPRDERVHIAIDRTTRTASEGALFMTTGLSFTQQASRAAALGQIRRLALVATTAGDATAPQTRIGALGGERRTVTVRPLADPLPDLPDRLVENIVKDRHCRLILLTPAYFAAGYRPAWLLQTHHGVTPQLVALTVDRPQVVSGWDYHAKMVRPARRLAPAGTVLFLRLAGVAGSEPSAEAIAKWVKQTWLQPVSDDYAQVSDQPASYSDIRTDADQWRRDGYGLAALGTWDGNLQTMKVGQ